MKSLNKILMAALTLVISLVGFSYTLPETWQVSRSVVIAAQPESIHLFVEDLHKWPDWVVWSTQADPTLKYEYFGEPVGAGASQSWISEKTGSGKISIKESVSDKGIIYLESLGSENTPLQGSLRYELTPEGTKVTWTQLGAIGLNPISRYLGLFMDSKVGDQLQASLQNLKRVVQSHGT